MQTFFKPFEKKPRWTAAARRRVKARFEEMGIFTCELRFKGCQLDHMLSFAHRLSQRKIYTDEEMEQKLVLACIPCHQKADGGTREEQERIITEAIERRNGTNRDYTND